MAEATNSGDLSAIISKIIRNPEFGEMVREIRGDDDAGKTQEELLSALPGVMESVAPLLGGIGGEKNDNKAEEDSAGEAAESKAVSVGSFQKYDRCRAEKLMCALKPYLKPERCQVIDRCLSLLQLGDVMGAIGGIDSLLGLKK